MKKTRKMVESVILCVLISCVITACHGGGGGGGGGTSPFDDGSGTIPGGGGGTGSSSLVGTWNVTSASGTVAYGTTQLGTSLATTVNNNMSQFTFSDAMWLQFDAKGNTSIYLYGELVEQATYTLSGGKLTIKDSENNSSTMPITLSSATEFTLDASGTLIAAALAYVIGDYLLSQNGYTGMEASGLSVTAANLTIKFQKK